MSWLKLGRWALIGIASASGAAACGGRGNLASGELGSGGDPNGEPFGGSVSVAGKSSSAGSVSVGGGGPIGGSPVGGSFGTAGTVAAGGSGPILCPPGFATCQGSSIAICDGSGSGYLLKDCGPGQRCVQNGDFPSCQPLVCTPGQMLCDASGTFVQVCSADGLTVKNAVNCGAQGQRCRDGLCRSLACQPNALFCDEDAVRLCNLDGSASTPLQNCGANQYCDPATFSCKLGVCAPSQPACNGSIATTCNANGSGYLPKGTDCAKQPDRQCVLGACLCPPSLADCDGLANTGCEANVSTDPDNCSGCGLVCSSNHVAERTCHDACDGTCQTGFQDCNGDKLKDGCETGTTSNAKNCGGCGIACSSNHVTPSCAGSVCNGECSANFADCNANKQADGCESDSRTDAKNCGACGVACSASHVKPVCAAGTCSGDCAAGFADCNDNKQTDGCEINTRTDAKNCGGCGLVCADGQSCSNGSCTSLLTFSGIAQNLKIASLAGWSQCYQDSYGTSSSLASIQQTCSGSQLMLACRQKGSDTLQLAAHAPRADVLFDTGPANVTHAANGVGWYFDATGSSSSWGFAPQGDEVSRNSCDTQDSSINGVGVDGQLRLCWHTDGGSIQGGWRCGRNDNLNGSFAFERLVFQAP
jgi:hypothetical protein